MYPPVLSINLSARLAVIARGFAGVFCLGLAMAALPAKAAPEYQITPVFISGEEYPVFRIPAVVRANDGTLLAFCEGRASFSDSGNIDLVLKRSTDNGETWGPLILVQEEGGTAPITIGNPAPVVDRTTGYIHLLFTRQNDRVFHTVSTDNGLTWSAREEITSAVKLENWGWYATGPCHGIQLTRGEQAGRLVVPANHRLGPDGSDSGAFGAQIIYSDDHGATWQMDVYADAANGAAPNETTLVELNTPGSPLGGGTGSHIYINSRDYGSDPGNRSEAYSGDGGSSYSVPYNGNPHFDTPICQGSLLRFSATDEGDDQNRILFSSPNGSSRSNGSLWTSTDETASWSAPKTIYAEGFAYSDMTKTSTGELGILAECDPGGISYSQIQFIRVNEAWLDEPPPPAENPGAAFWNFEEKAVGESADTSSDAILDRHHDENGRHLTAQAAFPYVDGAAAFPGSRALALNGNGGLRIFDNQTENNFDFAGDDSFTIEAAFRLPEGSDSTGALVAKDLGTNRPSWWLRVEGDGRLRFLVADESSEVIASSGDVRVNDGNWHRAAAVKDAAADRLLLYLNGVLIDNVEDITSGSHANAQSLWIGRFNASDREFAGEIDFVRIVPQALNASEFVSAYTQWDSDADDIPDAFERVLTGGTARLGFGDEDGDGVSDLMEFASGSLPTDPGSLPRIDFGFGSSQSLQLTHRVRDLPAWLTLVAEFSDSLSGWETSFAGASISSTSSNPEPGMTEYITTLSFTEGLPECFFSRLSLESLQSP